MHRQQQGPVKSPEPRISGMLAELTPIGGCVVCQTAGSLKFREAIAQATARSPSKVKLVAPALRSAPSAFCASHRRSQQQTNSSARESRSR